MDLTTSNVVIPGDGSEIVLWLRSYDNLSDRMIPFVVWHGPADHSGMPHIGIWIQAYHARCEM